LGCVFDASRLASVILGGICWEWACSEKGFRESSLTCGNVPATLLPSA
jgi:hypothetical protein